MKKQWSLVALGEVITHNKEYIEEPEPKIYPKLSVKLYGRGVVLDDSADGSLLRMKKHQIAKNGQVILSEIWGKKGAIGFVPPEGDGALCTSHFFLFDVNYEKLEPKYLQAIFIANYLQNQLDAEAKGTTGYAAVRPKHLLSAKIPLPPLEEQRRIVARIEELAAKVEEARGLRRQSVEYGLPSLRNGIFRKAFQGKFLDYSTNEFHKDELSSIGKWVRLGDICSLITDGTHQTPTYTEKGMMFLSAQNIKPYRFMPENHKYVSYEDYLAYTARNKVQKGDILITRVGAGIGEVAMVDQDIDFAIYVSLGHIRAIQDFVYTPYLVHWLNSPAGVAQSRDKILGKGHSQGNLNLNLIRQFLVPLPPLPEQRHIVAYLDNLQAKVDALKRLQAETAAELDALLPSILDKAFKGEL
jgi:type I restriction enzyme S subunit